MFSLSVVGSDQFLDMPATARELYFQLGMYADDDGFVSPRKVMRLCGASEDDYKFLIGKKFVIPFESGVIVIRHWGENNYIQKDRYKPSLFSYEKGLLTQDNEHVYKLDTECTPRLGKDRLGTSVATAPREVYEVDSSTLLEKVKTPAKYPHAREVFSWFPSPEKSWDLNVTELKHAELLFERGEEAVKGILEFHAAHEDYFDRPKVNKPSDLERKWEDIKAFAKRNEL